MLKDAGYATACMGKWGMGRFDSTGSPLKTGFDHFFGYNCQRHAHDYFPKFLYRDDKRFELPGNPGTGVGETFAQNLIQENVLKWIRAQKERPFFLCYGITLPHAQHEIDELGIYADKPWTLEQKSCAAQVTRFDRDVGQVLDLLKELGIEDNTLVMVSGGQAPKRDYFYWELHEGQPMQALRFGNWKTVRNTPAAAIELYDIGTDAAEENNLAAQNPDLVKKAEGIMKSARAEDPSWPLRPAARKKNAK